MSDTAVKTDQRMLQVWDGKIEIRVNVAGEGNGDPLVFLHPAGGFHWDPCLLELAKTRTVYAPEMPGTSVGAPHFIHAVDDLDDLVLIHEETIRKLNLGVAPVIMGQSFGGMLTLELAARYPGMFSQVIVLAPLGLWRDDMPVANFIEASPAEMPSLLFHDPESPAAAAMLTPPADPEIAIEIQAAMVWAIGCVGKFMYPIPDRGLRKRLHRIDTPTLIVWGEHDRLVPVGYANDFAEAIAGSRVEVIADSGHNPQLEQTDATLAIIRDFIGTA